MKDVKMAAGTYTNRNGEEKTNWVTIGSLIEKGDKQYVKIYATLTTPEVFCSVWDQKPREDQQAPRDDVKTVDVDDTTEVPF